MADAPFIVFAESLQAAGLPGQFFGRGQQAVNEGDQGTLTRCIECLELLHGYVSDTATLQMRDLLLEQADILPNQSGPSHP